MRRLVCGGRCECFGEGDVCSAAQAVTHRELNALHAPVGACRAFNFKLLACSCQE